MEVIIIVAVIAVVGYFIPSLGGYSVTEWHFLPSDQTEKRYQ